MTALATLAVVAAVLSGQSVSFVDAEAAALLVRLPLPGEGAAIFAAPDGRVLVPLLGSDATAVIPLQGKSERWTGRLFPLFFDEFDRMYVILEEEIAALSYPERVSLLRRDVDGVRGAWRAGCSADGRVVAVVPADDRGQLVVLAPRDPRFTRKVALTAAAVAVSVSPDGGWVAVAEQGGNVEVLSSGSADRVALKIGAEIKAMALASSGEWLVVATSQGGVFTLTGVRVRGAAKPLKVRFESSLAEEPRAVALTDKDALVVSPPALMIFDQFGRRFRGRVDLEDGRGVAVLPAQVMSVVPDWGDDRDR
jgi:hypothetical protein